MTLSENYIQRLKNIAGIEVPEINVISEADNREVITKKIGLPQAIADWAHNLSDKYSIWIANTFKDKYYRELPDSSPILSRMQPAVRDEVLKQISSGKPPAAILKEMLRSAEARSGPYLYALDWLRGRNTPPVRETDQLDFKTLTYDEALRRSNAWHNELKKLQGGAVKDEDGEVVMTFPDGFYWINLGKSRCEKEAQAMGHCGSGRGVLYSLRRDKHPFVTVDLVNGVIGQIKGRANTKPKTEFHQYIIPFLLDKKLNVQYLKSSYQPHTDFELNDITDEQLNDLIKKKPILLTGSESAARRLSPEVLESVLNLILKNYPEYFRTHWTRFLEDTALSMHIKIQMVDYILLNHLNWLKYEQGKGITLIERWPFTESQKDFLIKKQDEGQIDALENVHLSNMGFTKAQITKMVKNIPSIFDPNKQDFEALGITVKGIEYIRTKSPETISEKKFESLLSEDEMKVFFKKNPAWTQSVYLQVKYRGYEGVKSLKESPSGGFTPKYVEVLYDDWSDEELAKLFNDEDARRVESITSDDLYDGGYDYEYGHIDDNFSDLNSENIAYVQYLLKKAFTAQKGMYDADKKKIQQLIMAMKYNEMADVIGDPDIFTEEHEIEEYNEHIIAELKKAFTWAVEDAQRSADEGEVWKEFTNPVREFFGGEPTWKEKEVKKYDKETGKSKMEKVTFLRFEMPYAKFLELLKVYEDVESSDDEYTILLSDGWIYPTRILSVAVRETDALSMKDLNYISGSIDKDNLNERFSERMHEELHDELKNAKVVVKKKKKVK